jgi:hypothetical protein
MRRHHQASRLTIRDAVTLERRRLNEKGRVVPVSRKNRQSRLRFLAPGSDSESWVLLLVKQRLIEVGGSLGSEL